MNTVTEIKIIHINAHNDHIGNCSFVLNNVLKFNNVGIHTHLSGTGIRLVFPRAHNHKLQAVYPLTKELSVFITKAVEKVLVASGRNLENVNYDNKL